MTLLLERLRYQQQSSWNAKPQIFANAKFELHKWHANEPELETNCENYEPTFAKQHLGSTFTPGKGKLLGVPWDKSEDTLGVPFSNSPA